MKAIILSAGQGSRLLPLTEDCPKCLLPLGGRTILEHQVEQLAAAGVKEVVVVTGFRAAAVEGRLIRLRKLGVKVRTVFNPFYNVADNLASCWMARAEMEGGFLLLNGDTLFEPEIARRLVAAPAAPITLTIDRKDGYDSDDMKVVVDGTRLREVGKTLPLERVNGESIGFSRFDAEGAQWFTEVLDQEMRTPNGLSWWYLKAVGVLAERGLVQTCSIEGLTWGEVDFPDDLARAQMMFGAAAAAEPTLPGV